MNRDDFIRFLARTVADNTITEDEAVDLLRQFDLDLLNLDTLPLLASEMNSSVSDELIAAVLVALSSLLGRRARTQETTSDGRFIADAIQDSFEDRVNVLARRVVDGAMDVRTWQEAMNEAALRNIAEQTLAGGGSERLNIAQRQRIRGLMREQNAYLSRFADTIAAKTLIGTVLTSAYIANRARNYGGLARGEYFRANEESENNPDAVYEYVARDDAGTCSPCSEAQGFYLPGEGAYPGVICEGRGNCRCKRELRIMPDVARRLREG